MNNTDKEGFFVSNHAASTCVQTDGVASKWDGLRFLYTCGGCSAPSKSKLLAMGCARVQHATTQVWNKAGSMQPAPEDGIGPDNTTSSPPRPTPVSDLGGLGNVLVRALHVSVPVSVHVGVSVHGGAVRPLSCAVLPVVDQEQGGAVVAHRRPEARHRDWLHKEHERARHHDGEHADVEPNQTR